jgi:hypothetical protein
VLVAVAARSLLYQGFRLDLAAVAKWLDRFAVLFSSARAARGNEQGKGSCATFDGQRCCSNTFGPRSYFLFDVHVCVCVLVYRSRGRPPYPPPLRSASSAEGLLSQAPNANIMRLACTRLLGLVLLVCCALANKSTGGWWWLQNKLRNGGCTPASVTRCAA